MDLDFSRTGAPPELTLELEGTWREVRRCRRVGAFTGAVVLCGKMIETILAALCAPFLDVAGTRPGIGKMIGTLKERGVILDDDRVRAMYHVVETHRNAFVHARAQAASLTELDAVASCVRALVETTSWPQAL